MKYNLKNLCLFLCFTLSSIADFAETAKIYLFFSQFFYLYLKQKKSNELTVILQTLVTRDKC